jgi:NitT/TauT family transport system permease protein
MAQEDDADSAPVIRYSDPALATYGDSERGDAVMMRPVERSEPTSTTQASGAARAQGSKDRTRNVRSVSYRAASHRIVVTVAQVALAAVAIAVWQYIGSRSVSAGYTISTPGHVADYLWKFVTGTSSLGGWQDLWITLGEAAVGYFIGVLVGIALAIGVSTSIWLERFTAPFVSAINALPKVALAPLFILYFGSTFKSKVYFVAAGIFFLSFYNVVNGMKSIDPRFVRNGRALGANRLWLARDIYLPSIVGWVAASLRLSAAFAIGGAVISEYLGALRGIGYVIYTAQESYNPAAVIGGILIVGFAALIVDRVIVRIQRHFSSWRLQ